MVSRAVYPALDRNPAGLSPAMVGGELRTALGFTGVTITDALEARALRAFGTFSHRAVLAPERGWTSSSARKVTWERARVP